MQGRDDNRIWPPFSSCISLAVPHTSSGIHSRSTGHIPLCTFSIRYTTRAIACAVATVACAGPNRARKRRYMTPKAQSAFFTDCAAIRNACPARFLVFKCFVPQYLAPGDLVFGRQSQPGAEMLLGRKLLPDIAPHFHDHRLRQRDPKAIHQAQIHTTDPIQVFADLLRILRCILAVRVPLLVRYRWQFSALPIGTYHSILTIDLLVTGLDLLRVKIIQLQRLLQDKQMLFPPSPGQRFSNLLFTVLATRVPQRCQHPGIPLPCHDRADDLLPGHSRHIRHRLRELHVHLQQRLLHVLNMRRAMFHQLSCDVATTSATPPDLPVDGTILPTIHKCATSGSTAHLRHRLLPCYSPQRTRANQQTFKSLAFQLFKQRDPIHSCAFHRNRFYPDALQPFRNGLQVHRVVPKGFHDLQLFSPPDTQATISIAPISTPAAFWFTLAHPLKRMGFFHPLCSFAFPSHFASPFR